MKKKLIFSFPNDTADTEREALGSELKSRINNSEQAKKHHLNIISDSNGDALFFCVSELLYRPKYKLIHDGGNDGYKVSLILHNDIVNSIILWALGISHSALFVAACFRWLMNDSITTAFVYSLCVICAVVIYSGFTRKSAEIDITSFFEDYVAKTGTND